MEPKPALDEAENELHIEAIRSAGMAEIEPSTFLKKLYGGDEWIPITKSGENGGRGTWKRVKTGEAEQIVKERSDAYIYPVRFFHCVPNADLVCDLLAFVVDLDDVNYGGLLNLIEDMDKDKRMKPSHLVRTGGGVHLWYRLDNPIQYRKLWRNALHTINNGIYSYWKENALGCVADQHSRGIPHAFRAPGSRTKDGTRTATVWEVEPGRTTVDIADLVEAMKQEPSYKDGRAIDFYKTEDLEQYRAQAAEKAKKKDYRQTANSRQRRHPGLYEYTRDRIARDTRKGHRYLSMWSLASLGYQCGIDKRQVKKDLEGLAENWSKGSNPITSAEVEKALKGYSERWIELRKSTREELQGWLYEPGPKRNKGDEHKTRSEHIREVNEIRSGLAEVKIRRAMKAAEAKRKTGEKAGKITIKEIAETAKVSYPTALKYVRIVKQE